VQNHNSPLRVRFNSVFCFSAQLLLHFVPFSKSQLTLLIFISPSVLSDYIDSALTLSCASAFFFIVVVIVQAGRKRERLLVSVLGLLYFYAKEMEQLC
jgi:hypothetical protein